MFLEHYYQTITSHIKWKLRLFSYLWRFRGRLNEYDKTSEEGSPGEVMWVQLLPFRQLLEGVLRVQQDERLVGRHGEGRVIVTWLSQFRHLGGVERLKWNSGNIILFSVRFWKYVRVSYDLLLAWFSRTIANYSRNSRKKPLKSYQNFRYHDQTLIFPSDVLYWTIKNFRTCKKSISKQV